METNRGDTNWGEETPMSKGRNGDAVTHTQEQAHPRDEQGNQSSDEIETRCLKIANIEEKQGDGQQNNEDTSDRNPIRAQASLDTESTAGHPNPRVRADMTPPEAHNTRPGETSTTGTTKMRTNPPKVHPAIQRPS